MPTEKYAAFLAMQKGFKLDRQRVKINGRKNDYSSELTTVPLWRSQVPVQWRSYLEDEGRSRRGSSSRSQGG
jgi:hypothetical protein